MIDRITNAFFAPKASADVLGFSFLRLTQKTKSRAPLTSLLEMEASMQPSHLTATLPAGRLLTAWLQTRGGEDALLVPRRETLTQPALPRRSKSVPFETEWRRHPDPPEPMIPRRLASRWVSAGPTPSEASADAPADCFVLGVALQSTSVRLVADGVVVQDGPVLPGMLHVSEPGSTTRCSFRGPADALHVFISQDLVRECAASLSSRNMRALRPVATLQRDPLIQQLSDALVRAEDFDDALGSLYVDGLSIAIVTRLLAVHARRDEVGATLGVTALAKWRMKRTIEFVEAHLAESISLADLAAVAGLSRMHFAAQFRAGTGYRPHHYLLLRRIIRAQTLLLGNSMSLADVAVQVGFKTQAHFTTQFKRFIGTTPQMWRKSCD